MQQGEEKRGGAPVVWEEEEGELQGAGVQRGERRYEIRFVSCVGNKLFLRLICRMRPWREKDTVKPKR